MKRFSNYLMREILPLYGAGFIAFMLLLLVYILINLLASILSRGAPISLVAQFLLYNLPAAAGPAIPLALLFATLLGLARLVQDSEVKAALLLGIGPGRFLWPIVLLGILIALVGVLNKEFVIPWSQRKALEVQKDLLLQSPESFLQTGSFFSDALGRSIYIEGLEADGGFRGITVIQGDGSDGPSLVIHAEKGKPDKEAGLWVLENVEFSTYRNGRLVSKATSNPVLLPVRELSSSETEAELDTYPLKELITRIRNSGPGEADAEWVALHRKLSEPLAAIAFAVFSLAVALVSFRRAAGLGLVAVLFLTFIYYATWTLAKVSGDQGLLPAWIAGWLAFALYAVVGSVLLVFSWRR